jgi:hypothetical protein
MNTVLTRYFAGCYIYGTLRNLVYAPKIKENEYIIDHVAKFCAWTAATPIMAPTFLYCDLRNIEQKLRKMPGPIDKSPW